MAAPDRQLSDKSVPRFSERPSNKRITPAARHLLENYAKIAPEEVEDHVVKVRGEAWEVFPYPCIGQFRFLELSLNQTAQYADILQRLQDGQRLLDMACCFGQEIRQLMFDGAPPKNVYGCDLREEYIRLGYKLFSDQDTLQSRFLTADIFDATSALIELHDQFDIVYAVSFFHLWGYKDQVRVSVAVAKLLRPQKGSMILGRQVGAVNAAAHAHATNPARTMFRHNVESLRK